MRSFARKKENGGPAETRPPFGERSRPYFAELLELNESGVKTITSKEHVVVTFFGNAAVVNDDDAVGALDRRETVRDHDDRDVPVATERTEKRLHGARGRCFRTNDSCTVTS